VNGLDYFGSDLGHLEALVIIPMSLPVSYYAGYFLTSSTIRASQKEVSMKLDAVLLFILRKVSRLFKMSYNVIHNA
jgi:hypothetical protein